MSIPILATKLYIPTSRNKLVIRHHLIEQLNAGIHGKLILISAPVGFGKTTLISAWLNSYNIPTAWLSLDKGDNDLSRFLTYLIAAIQTIAPHIGDNALAMLQTNQPPAIESILTILLNDLAPLPEDFLLVLDDYHLIDAKSVNDAVVFLLDHLPPQMHLVVTTREDPNLPLARLRARRQMTELRASNLRFSQDEASMFFHQVMGLDLPAKAIIALEERTEGWIAGLQLAALSLQGHQDFEQFIQSFGGDHRYIVDYLVEEVLARQSERVRNFLLQTAILDQMNGSLCDAVTGQHESKARLETLYRGNFFLIPLDDRNHWYRYHHLFAEVLRMHLMMEQSDQIAELHLRASEWYEQNGSVGDAIRHALSGKDFARAARLIEVAIPELRRSRQESTMLGWLEALPDEVLRCRPVLSVHYAGSLLQSGKLEGVERRLRDAEQWLEPKADTGEMVVMDEEEFRGLAGSIAMYHAAIALTSGDLVVTMKYAQRVLDLVPEDDHLRRGAAVAFIGLVNWRHGELEAAHQSYVECMTRLQRVGFISDAIGCSITLADLRITQGRLREAMQTYESGLQLATLGASFLRGAADMLVGISQLHYEHDDLNAATQYLLRSQKLGDLAGLPQNQYRWRVAMARLHQANGDLDGALNLLEEAEPLYMSDFSPNVRPIPALKTRVWLAQGRLDEALDWVREQGLSIENDLSYLREFEHITLARVLLARYKRNPNADDGIIGATELLERLLKAAEDGKRAGSMVEILILQALAHQMQGDITPALAALERAFKLAEPEGYIRIFLDEGSNMETLLHKAAELKIMPDYATTLLDAFHKHQTVAEEPHIATMLPSQDLIESLSQRELEVLRMFKTDLSGPEIARELVIGLSTVRTHTKSIYSKLNVNNRRSAVTRAIELKLI